MSATPTIHNTASTTGTGAAKNPSYARSSLPLRFFLVPSWNKARFCWATAVFFMAWFFLPLRQACVFGTTVYSVIRYGRIASGIWHIFSKPPDEEADWQQGYSHLYLPAQNSSGCRQGFFSETCPAPTLSTGVGKEGGSNPTPVATDALVTRNSPLKLTRNRLIPCDLSGSN